MWTGIPPLSSAAASAASFFGCPKQPLLRLPLSRINDGICDCCDGSDEKQQQHHCPNICDAVLAADRETRQKLEQDYSIGSQLRASSIMDFRTWHDDMQVRIQRYSKQDIPDFEWKVQQAKKALIKAQLEFVKKWTLTVEEVLRQPTLRDFVTNNSHLHHHHYQQRQHRGMGVRDLALLIISLCQLSGETSADQVTSNGRCVPFDRASLDIGILWDSSEDDGEEDGNKPTFQVFDAENEESLVDYAEKLLARLEGSDNRRNNKMMGKKKQKEEEEGSSSNSNNNHAKRTEPENDENRHDLNDHDDFYYDEDDLGHLEDFNKKKEQVSENVGDTNDKGDESNNGNADDVAVKSLLENLPLLAVRDSFKGNAKSLLASLPTTDDKEVDTDAKENDGSAVAEDEISDDGGVDPMALTMVRSTISRRLGNIVRGETSSKSAAASVYSLIEKSNSALDDLQRLAIMTMYRSNVTSEDVAEIIYTLIFPSEGQEGDGSDQSCSTSWSRWCPLVKTVSQNGDKSLIVAAAERRCSKLEDTVGVCSGKEGEQEKGAKFPLIVPDGYFTYYEPKVRSHDDELSYFFSAMDSLSIPEELTGAKKKVEDLDKKLSSSKRELEKFEAEIGNSDALKYGIDGELFTMRDTCHKFESGKYEYELCIFGKATQRDIGQKSGGTSLGSWDKVLSENGQRTLRWDRGTKCWNGPQRSADVLVTCGRTTKVLSADEPETCRYVFTMESPIACDEQFKMNNSL